MCLGNLLFVTAHKNFSKCRSILKEISFCNIPTCVLFGLLLYLHVFSGCPFPRSSGLVFSRLFAELVLLACLMNVHIIKLWPKAAVYLNDMFPNLFIMPFFEIYHVILCFTFICIMCIVSFFFLFSLSPFPSVDLYCIQSMMTALALAVGFCVIYFWFYCVVILDSSCLVFM